MTTNDPFAINEQEQIQDRFAIMVFAYGEVNDRNGEPYWQYTVQYANIGGKGNSDLKTVKYGNFAHSGRSKVGNTPTDTKLFLESLTKNFPNPAQLAQKTDGVYVRYHWKDWEDYSKGTIEHFKQNSPEKLQANERGRLYVTKGAFYIDEVYPDENTALAAHDNIWGIENTSEGAINNAFTISGNSAPTAPPAQPNATKETAAAFLPWIVKTAMNGGNRVDLNTLAQMIAGNDVLKVHFTVDSAEVQAEIAKLETEPAF
jgi:hypothetical protein